MLSHFMQTTLIFIHPDVYSRQQKQAAVTKQSGVSEVFFFQGVCYFNVVIETGKSKSKLNI